MTNTAIEPFEDEAVTGVRLILTKTGDGLSKSLQIAPVVLRRHESCDLVVRAKVAKIRYDDAKDGDGADRVQILECEAIVVVTDNAVRKLLDEHAKKLAHQKELEGQQTSAALGGVEDDGDGEIEERDGE